MLYLKGYPVCIYMAGDENKGTQELRPAFYCQKIGDFCKNMAGSETTKKKSPAVLSLMLYVFGGLGRPVEGVYKNA